MVGFSNPVVDGTSYTITCQQNPNGAIPAPEIKWLQGNLVLAGPTTATSLDLTITPDYDTDEGKIYDCVAFNAVGEKSASVTLLVHSR